MEQKSQMSDLRKISILKRILLYLNASVFRITKEIPNASDYRKNYRALNICLPIMLFSEYGCIKFIFSDITNQNLLRCLTVLFAYHIITQLFFTKDIIIMGYNYNSYYNKGLFFIALIFMVTGIVGFILMFNSMIGHLPK